MSLATHQCYRLILRLLETINIIFVIIFPMKSEMYEALRLLNQHFDQLSQTLELLQKLGLLNVEFVEARQISLEEIRARTNCNVAQVLHEREARDWSNFEDLRIHAVRRELESHQRY